MHDAIQQTPTTNTAIDIGQTAKSEAKVQKKTRVAISLTNPRERSACFCALANPMPASSIVVTNVITVVFIVIFNVEVSFGLSDHSFHGAF